MLIIKHSGFKLLDYIESIFATFMAARTLLYNFKLRALDQQLQEPYQPRCLHTS